MTTPTPGLVARMAARVAGAVQKAEPATRAARLAACRACPHLRKSPIERCGLCGCPIAGKTLLQGATCPDKPPRW